MYRRLVSRLKQLGGNELLPLGLGDDQAIYGYLTALDGWIAALVNILRPQCDISGLLLPSLDAPQYRLQVSTIAADQSTASRWDDVKIPEGYEYTTSSPIRARVLSNSRVTSPSWNQNVFHLSLDLPREGPASPSSPPSHIAGDVLLVYPSNPSDAVELALSLFCGRAESLAGEGALSGDSQVNFHRAAQGAGARRNRLEAVSCSLRELFSRVLDITAVPQRSFFEQLSLFAASEEEREKLLELSSSEGADLYYNYCLRERRGFIEVLSEFKSCTVPLERLPELIPPLRPRHYSIASSGRSHCYPNEVHSCSYCFEFVVSVTHRVLLGPSVCRSGGIQDSTWSYSTRRVQRISLQSSSGRSRHVFGAPGVLPLSQALRPAAASWAGNWRGSHAVLPARALRKVC